MTKEELFKIHEELCTHIINYSVLLFATRLYKLNLRPGERIVDTSANQDLASFLKDSLKQTREGIPDEPSGGDVGSCGRSADPEQIVSKSQMKRVATLDPMRAAEELEFLRKDNAVLRMELMKAVQYLKEGKVRFSPHTTNSLVDDFIEKHRGVCP